VGLTTSPRKEALTVEKLLIIAVGQKGPKASNRKRGQVSSWTAAPAEDELNKAYRLRMFTENEVLKRQAQACDKNVVTEMWRAA
jgi:hypothetical protein